MARKRTKALSYLRVSGRGQVRGDGFPRQRSAVRRYAKRNGIEVVGEFRDGAVSGSLPLAERPGLLELLGRVASNGVCVVLVEKYDRLGRDLIEGELILRQLRADGVTVIEAEDGNELTAGDGDNPTKKLIRQVLGAVADFDKTSLVLRLKAARERTRRERGRCEGRKFYGELPGEAEVLAELRRLRRKARGGKQLSFGAIARVLNERGILSRSGRLWAEGTVRTILQRPGNLKLVKENLRPGVARQPSARAARFGDTDLDYVTVRDSSGRVIHRAGGKSNA